MTRAALPRLGTFPCALLIANLGLWVYFWVAFSAASYPFRVDPLGHPAGSGYTFWGHSIAVVESGLVYPFFKVMFYAEFPAFAVVTLVARLFPIETMNGFIAGISGGGWMLLGVMTLSFVQWYFVGLLLQTAWQKWVQATLKASRLARQ